MVWRTEGKSDQKRKKLKLKKKSKTPRKLVKSNRKEAGKNCQLTFTSKEKFSSKPFSSCKKHHTFPVCTAVKRAHFTQKKAQENKPNSLKACGNHFTQLGQNPIGALSVSITALVHQSTSSLCQLQGIWSTDRACVSVDSFTPCRASDCPGWTTPLCSTAPQKPHKCSSTFVPSWTELI